MRSPCADFLALQARGSENERELLAGLRERLFSRGEPELSALRGGLDILRDADLRAVLPGITRPVLAIAGQRDKLTPPQASHYLARALPNARAVEIQGRRMRRSCRTRKFSSNTSRVFCMNEFEIDKREVRRAFSKAAETYDAAAVLQREVCVRMLEKLDFIKLAPHRILDVGSGTGWGARQLGGRYKGAEVIALDIAIGMLQASRGTSSWWQKLFAGHKQRYLCADAEALPLAAQSVDMAWSNLALQWCNDLPATFAGLHRVLKTDGLLMFSTFGPDTLRELGAAFQGVDDYRHISRFADMHDVGDMLVAAGFADPVMEMEKITLTYPDVKAVLQDLRSIGAHNAAARRVPGMMGKGRWARFVQNYETLRRDGKLPATFEVIYGHAWKVPPKHAADGRAVIRTDFRV